MTHKEQESKEQIKAIFDLCHTARISSEATAGLLWILICEHKPDLALVNSIERLNKEVGAIIQQRVDRVLSGDFDVLPVGYGVEDEENGSAQALRFQCRALWYRWSEQVDGPKT